MIDSAVATKRSASAAIAMVKVFARCPLNVRMNFGCVDRLIGFAQVLSHKVNGAALRQAGPMGAVKKDGRFRAPRHSVTARMLMFVILINRERD